MATPSQDEVDQRVSSLDIDMFRIASATSEGDKRSLLRVQNLMRRERPGYTFLEIGSFYGGGLYPHLVDGKCGRVVSIDIRPDVQPDERAVMVPYSGITTQTMLDELAKHADPLHLAKLVTHGVDARHVAVERDSVDLALVDGEHTNIAVFSDFVSIYPMLKKNAVVVFHDLNLVSDGVINIRRMLDLLNVDHEFLILPDCVAVLALGTGIPTARRDLQPFAADEEWYFRTSKIALREQIARNVAEGRHLA